MLVAIYYIQNILNWIIWLYSIVMVIDAIMSWIPFLRDSAIGQIINRIIDPYVSIFRKGPIEQLSNSTGIDFSFLLALLLLYFVQEYAIGWLYNILFRIFA